MLSPEQIEALPRLEHGGTYPRCETYHLLTLDRMSLGRGFPGFQLGQHWEKAPFIVEHDAYEDCSDCREERSRYATASGLSWAKRDDLYWCNRCQGTGWMIESWEAARTRLGIVTWADKAALLSTPELLALNAGQQQTGVTLIKLKQRMGERGWPPAVIAEEMARRLEAAHADCAR